MDSYITIRFIRTEGFVTSAICWVTNSLIDHAEFGTPEGAWIGAHSDGGVQERRADYCKPKVEFVYHVPCTAEQAALLVSNARSEIGLKYNYGTILGILFRIRKWGRKTGNDCSQFCTRHLLKIGMQPLNVLPEFAYLITPETLHLSPLLIGHRTRRIG